MGQSYEWEKRAACVGKTRMFYSLSVFKQAEAKDICMKKCPVQKQCLAAAMLRGEDYGIWGGCTPPELRRAKNIALLIADFEGRVYNEDQPKKPVPTLQLTIPVRLKISLVS